MHEHVDSVIENNIKSKVDSRRWRLVPFTVTYFTLIHIGSIYGIYLTITKATWQTCVFAYVLYMMGTIGVTAGAHRLWSHKAYKVKLPLKLILLLFYTIAYQLLLRTPASFALAMFVNPVIPTALILYLCFNKVNSMSLLSSRH